MDPKEVIDLMIGSKIIDVKYGRYLTYNLTIQEIHLDNGIILEFGGNADEAYIGIVEDVDTGKNFSVE